MKNLLFLSLLMLGLTACQNNEPNPELEKLKQEKAEVEKMAAAKDSTINSFLQAMNDIEDNLREVRQKQGAVASSAQGGAELQGSAKDRITDDINAINELMEENKRKLANLQSKLKKSNLKSSELEKTIERMTAQLEEKDKEIATLKEQLASMNIQIAELNTNVSNLQAESAAKTATIEQQTTKMNTAWYVVGTVKELKNNKVLDARGGFLGIGKKKTLKPEFNQDYFTQIDITKVKSIPVNGKDPKFLTNHPTSAYKLELDGKKRVKSISILDAERFWRSSKYLVVTVDK